MEFRWGGALRAWPSSPLKVAAIRRANRQRLAYFLKCWRLGFSSQAFRMRFFNKLLENKVTSGGPYVTETRVPRLAPSD